MVMRQLAGATLNTLVGVGIALVIPAAAWTHSGTLWIVGAALVSGAFVKITTERRRHGA